MQHAPKRQRDASCSFDHIACVRCSALVVQVRENVRGASLEGKALKTELGLKVGPAVVSPCVGMYWSLSCACFYRS